MNANTVVPISPADVAMNKAMTIPAHVIESFNTLITKHWSGTQAMFTQDDVIAAILAKIDTSRQHIFSQRWLDVEPYFRAYGWNVEYDKPGYNDYYVAKFIFRAARST